MASIFVSYRRSDAPGHAGRLYDRLAERFGDANVFKDLDSMEPGADFGEVIKDTVGRCDALIAVIGKEWLALSSEGVSRLDDPDDWVRVEIANALARKVRVVPVLVEGANMPAPSRLPEDVRPLTRRHAVALNEDVWRLQVTQLVDGLERATGADRSEDQQAERRKGAWSVDGQWSSVSSDRVLTLELRSGERKHVLTVQVFGKESIWAGAAPLALLDGEKLQYPTFHEEGMGMTGRPEFQLGGIAGTSLGRLSFSAVPGELKYLLLTIDGELAYEHGDVPDYIRLDWIHRFDPRG